MDSTVIGSATNPGMEYTCPNCGHTDETYKHPDGPPNQQPAAPQPDDTREHPESRDHDTYKADHWDVVDIREVDKTFATPADRTDGKQTKVRIDLDGQHAPSVMSNLGEEGENVNTSIWLYPGKAEVLRDQLDEAIQEAKDAGRENED